MFPYRTVCRPPALVETMPPIVAVSREAMSTPNFKPAAAAAECTCASVAPAPTAIRPAATSTSPIARAFGGEQDVVVLGHRPGDQTGSPALNGDRYAARAAHVQHCRDFGGISGSDQSAGAPAVAPVWSVERVANTSASSTTNRCPTTSASAFLRPSTRRS